MGKEIDKNATGEGEITLRERDINLDAATAEDEAAKKAAAEGLEDKAGETAEVEGDEEETLDWDEIVAKHELDPNVGLEDYITKAKTAGQLESELNEILPLLNRAGIMDLAHLKQTLLNELDNRPARAKKEPPAAPAQAKQPDFFGKYGIKEEQRPFYNDLLEYIKSAASGNTDYGEQLETLAQSIEEAQTELYYDRLERQLERGHTAGGAKTPFKMQFSMPQLRLALSQISDKAIVEAKRLGKNPLELAYNYLAFTKGQQKPSIVPNGQTGTAKAQTLDKPGAVKAEEGGNLVAQFRKDPDAFVAKYGRKKAEEVMEKVK